jgi:hypothetical protein
MLDLETQPLIAVFSVPGADKRLSFLAQPAFLSSEGSLEPQIEDLIHRINELQQGTFGTLDWPVDTSSKVAVTQCLFPLLGPAKKRSSEELGEAQALQEAMHRELDSCEWGQKRDLGIPCLLLVFSNMTPGPLPMLCSHLWSSLAHTIQIKPL